MALTFARHNSATRLHLTAQEPPQRVVRAFSDDQDGAALVHLHNLSGGVLGGDRLQLQVTVMPQARGQVTTTGATRVYRHRPAYGDACQQTRFQVQCGALLEYLPDLLIPFAGSRYVQQTHIELAPDAGLFYWEVVAPGRVAAGESFAYERLQMQLTICAQGEPILLEHFVLEPAIRSLTAPARLGNFRYFGALYICRVGVAEAAWAALETELVQMAQHKTHPDVAQSDVAVWGVSRLPAHGLIVRAVAMHHQAIAANLPCFWDHAKTRLYATRAVVPRKLY